MYPATIIGQLDKQITQLRAEVTRLTAERDAARAALEWLFNLHNGISKDGPDCPVTNIEWADALEQSRAALRGEPDA